MNRKLAIYVLLLLPTASFADSSLLAFVQKYKGLYASEVQEEASFRRAFTSRRNVPSYESKVLYDDATRMITIATDLPLFPLLEVLELCVKTGIGTGTTAMGAKASFTRQNCNRVIVEPADGIWHGATKPIANHPLQSSITFSGDPKQYRDLNARGFDLQVTLTPIKPKGIVVAHAEALHQAKIDRRIQTMMDVYKLPAKILRIEYFFADGKAPFRVDTFE